MRFPTVWVCVWKKKVLVHKVMHVVLIEKGFIYDLRARIETLEALKESKLAFIRWCQSVQGSQLPEKKTSQHATKRKSLITWGRKDSNSQEDPVKQLHFLTYTRRNVKILIIYLTIHFFFNIVYRRVFFFCNAIHNFRNWPIASKEEVNIQLSIALLPSPWQTLQSSPLIALQVNCESS